MTQKNFKISGYTLVEMAIVVAVLGVMIASATGVYRSWLQTKTIATTQNNVSVAMNAMAKFLVQNGRYPCPAPLDAKRTDANYGMEGDCTDTSVAVGSCASGVCVERGEVNPALRVRRGAIPFRVLNLPEMMAQDGYYNRLEYVVTERLASAATYDRNGGAISVVDNQSPAQSVVSPPGSLAFLVLSRGADWRGAYTREGAQTVPCGSGADAENCNTTANPQAIYKIAPTSTGTGSSHFDDFIKMASTTEMPLWMATDSTGTDVRDVGVAGTIGIGLKPKGPLPATCTSGGTVSSSITTDTAAGVTTWICAGVNGGTTPTKPCTYTGPAVAVNGVCGNAEQACAAGISVGYSRVGGQATWSCQGINGGSTMAGCTFKGPVKQENGTCGIPAIDIKDNARANVNIKTNQICDSTTGSCFEADKIAGEKDEMDCSKPGHPDYDPKKAYSTGVDGKNRTDGAQFRCRAKQKLTCDPVTETMVGISTNGDVTCAPRPPRLPCPDGYAVTGFDPILGTICTSTTPITCDVATEDEIAGACYPKCAATEMRSGTACVCDPAKGPCGPTPTNGMCGGVSGLCAVGTQSGLNTSVNPNTWTCLGSDGASSSDDVACEYLIATNKNGECPLTNPDPFTTSCKTGLVGSADTSGNPITWKCLGVGTGTDADCTYTVPAVVKNGRCPDPTSETPVCADGIVDNITSVRDTTSNPKKITKKWTCKGNDPDPLVTSDDADCEYIKYGGQCGSGVGLITDETNACVRGAYNLQGTGPGTQINWTCNSEVDSPSCSYTPEAPPIGGTCNQDYEIRFVYSSGATDTLYVECPDGKVAISASVPATGLMPYEEMGAYRASEVNCKPTPAECGALVWTTPVGGTRDCIIGGDELPLLRDYEAKACPTLNETISVTDADICSTDPSSGRNMYIRYILTCK